MLIRLLAKLIGGGALDRVLDAVDKRVDAETDKNRIRADLLQEHMRTRPGFMQAGGFVLMLLFAVPLAFWFASVLLYSVFWCANCAFPQEWTVAALPAPLDQWASAMIVAIFGVVGINRLK